MSLERRDTVAAPYVVQTTGRFDGDDGKWSTFAIQIGTPPQSVRVLPGTMSTQVTIPVEEGCTGPVTGSLNNCGDLRGIDDSTRRGFIRKDSTSWSFNGNYQLLAQQDVIQDVGVYGTDVVQVGRSGDYSHNASIVGQAVAGISQIPFWLGSMGLSSAPTNMTSLSIPSLLSSMKNQSIIPSMSYGYTAGQAYNNSRLGSLVLGGYDKAQIQSAVVSFPIDTVTPFPRLELDVQGIVSQNAAGGASRGFLANPITVSIDTSVSHMWLPSSVCDMFVDAFGLAEDRSTGYFLLNDTMQSTLKSADPTLTFTIGGSRAGGTTNIVMSYSSLDMAVGEPIYNFTVPHFPIRRALNDSQLTFGRAFLQEAYLVVDWERSNFTIGPRSTSTQSTIVAIEPAVTSASDAPSSTATNTSTASSQSSSSGLGGGAIAGIVIPLLLIIAAVCGFLFLRRRRRQQRHTQLRNSVESQPPEYDPTGGAYYEVNQHSMSMTKLPTSQVSELFDSSKPRAELTSDNVRKLEEIAEQRELMSTPILELEGDRADSELDGSSTKGERVSNLSGMTTMRHNRTSPAPERVMSPLSRQSLYEME